MGLFTRRSASVDLWGSGTGSGGALRQRLAPCFEAVAEALAAGRSSVDACSAAGRAQAELGASLGESLDGLRALTRLLVTRDPLFEETHALSLAWSESVLGYLHGLSCADPLTGLSTHAHLRERIAELYRNALAHALVADPAGGVGRSHALVVTDVGTALDPITAARRLTVLGQTARSVFPGSEAIAQVGHGKVVVLARRTDVLPAQVALLRRMATRQAGRVWIEGLPDTDSSAARLLDELARA